MTKLIYCATPSRISNKIKQIMDVVTSKCYGPFHPFQAFELERFEHGPVGRDKTMEFCKRAVEICDEFWMFGVSEGTLFELNYALELGKPVQLMFEGFDPEWEEFYEKLGVGSGDLLNGLFKLK